MNGNQDNVLARIIALKTQPVSELKRLWRELYGSDCPSYHRRLLEARLAYRLQELTYGGLKPATVKKLEAIGEQIESGKRTRSKRSDARPVAGTRLMREWQGVTHEVIVQTDHFVYQGQRYKSLSAVARAITGTVWNGWTFFGLKNVGGAK